MTPQPTPTHASTEEARLHTAAVDLDRAHAEVKAEIARVDTKAGLLLALEGAAAAGLWTAATARPLPALATALACVSGALIVAAVIVLLLAVRPRLGGRHGFPLWATLTPAELSGHLAEQDLAEDIAGLARLATDKFERLQHAVDLTLAAIAPAVLAVAATLAAR